MAIPIHCSYNLKKDEGKDAAQNGMRIANDLNNYWKEKIQLSMD